jgi:hypothetical protein
VISLDLARRLKSSGLAWTPASGDRFVVPDRDLDDVVFTVSDMVVEVQELPTGTHFAFNGTTEWALDSVEQREAVWLPREDQLRELLGPAFVSLTAHSGGFVVEIFVHGETERHVDTDAACALARALLATRD